MVGWIGGGPRVCVSVVTVLGGSSAGRDGVGGGESAAQVLIPGSSACTTAATGIREGLPAAGETETTLATSDARRANLQRIGGREGAKRR